MMIERDAMKSKTEYEKFTDLMSGIMKVPHSEIKAKLDAEKKAKEQKKQRAKVKTK